MTTTSTDWRTYTTHPAAMLFPMMTKEEYRDLKASIAASGLMVPILKQGTVILDGRNRYQACKELDLEPTFEEYTGDDPAMEIFRRNFIRRNLTTDQKATILVKFRDQTPEVYQRWLKDKAEAVERRMANLKQGDKSRRLPGKPSGRTAQRTAEQSGLPKTAIERADRVRREHPEAVDPIIAGEVTSKAVIAHGGLDKAKAAKAAGKKAAKAEVRATKLGAAASIRDFERAVTRLVAEYLKADRYGHVPLLEVLAKIHNDLLKTCQAAIEARG
jgi:ParB-like chromosome segregation protein Spo0J